MAHRNEEFLSAVDSTTRAAIVGSIAEHYQVSTDVALDAVTEDQAADLLEYLVEPQRSATAVLMQRHGFSTPVKSVAQAKMEAVYAKREELVCAMAETGAIRPADLAKLDRLGRFTVARDHWGICDQFVREALLVDHSHVQSAARQSQRKAQIT